MHNYNMMGPAMGPVILSFILHVLIIAAIVWIVMIIVGRGRMHRMGRWNRHQMWQSQSSIELLNERYAKGEINKEEYEERKKTLMGQ
jgi:putative membrane protein